MNVEKEKKTFDYLFGLFVMMGESQLGRQLNIEEITRLKLSIAKKCESISKKDIVKEIYNLEKSRREQEKGHLSIKDKFKLRETIAHKTNCPVKYTSTTDDLARVVANDFTRIHFEDFKRNHTNLNFKNPAFIEKKRNLKNSYLNDNFHYKAPLSLSEQLIRYTALGLVGISGVSIMAPKILFNSQPTTLKEDSSISDTASTKTYTPQSYVENQLETTNTLNHFKSVVAKEYNNYHFTEEIDSDEITVISNSHEFFFRVVNSDYEYYIAPGDYPDEVEKILKTTYSTVEKLQNKNSNINIITVSDKNNTFLGGSAFFNNRYLPVITDGNYIMNNLESFYRNPTTILSRENNEIVGSFITKLCASHCFDALLVDSYDYATCMAAYIEQNPDNAYPREVMSVVRNPLLYARYNSEQFSNEELLQIYRQLEALKYNSNSEPELF